MSYKYTIPSFKNSKANNVKTDNGFLGNMREKVSNIFNNKNVNEAAKKLNNNTQKNTTKISNKISQVVSDVKGGFGIKHLLLLLLILVILTLIVVILYYVLMDCYDKKPLTQYLLDADLEPCATKYKPSSYKERVLEDEKEVFHLSNQDYTYEQAKCKCKAYSGRLATKQEIIEAYNKGAEWCSYGWSEGQTAYYPTQKCTWDKMQDGDPKHRYDCGMPGINGGFFSNPKLKFGINCYGIKPKGKIVKEKVAVCKGKDFCRMNVNYNSAHKLETDQVAPFNSNQWSQFN